MDVAANGNQRIAQLASKGLIDTKRLVHLTEVTGTGEADIEDLFEVDWYLKPLKESGVGAARRPSSAVAAESSSRWRPYSVTATTLRFQSLFGLSTIS